MNEIKKKVLAVDDEAPIRNITRTNLIIGGYEVVTASDGVECLQMVKNEKPDLVLLDVNMPRKNGWEVVKELKEDPELGRIPVIMLTGDDALSDMEQGARLGVEYYLTKPFEPRELLAVVKRALGDSPSD